MAKENLPCFPKSMIFSLIIVLMLLMCMEAKGWHTPKDEVNALKEIAEQLGKTNWNFSVDPCINELSWATEKSDWKLYNNTVQCNCSYPGGVCHVIYIFLKGQDLAGVLPAALAKLPSLRQIDLSRNYLSGNIPPEWASTKLEYVSLTANRLTGSIPSYLGNITTLKYLDLSFNRLEGRVPDLQMLTPLKTMYLTGNMLSGSIPEWIKDRESSYFIDLSYNNFSEKSVPPTYRESLNLFKSFSGWENSTLAVCLKGFQCPKEDLHSLNINCGGKETTIGNIKYEVDEEEGGPAKFYPLRATWGTSSTGHFWNANKTSKDYMATNGSILKMNDSQLYMNAGLSPLSLTYYAQCLANGNYTVKLHFAKIVFRGNKSFYSLGRWVFDVYIQGKLEWKDFDIEKAAQGVDTAFVMNFTAVVVTNKILEIRFHWAGKGTTAIPKRGTYGPLISAIPIKSNFKPHGSKTKILIEVIGALVSVLSIIFMILGILWWKGCLGGRTSREQDLKGLDLQA